MAATFNVSIGTAAQAASTTITLSTANAVASGANIYLFVGTFNSANPSGTFSVTTAGGLTWTEDKTLLALNVRTSMFRARAPSGLASSTSLTVTHSGAGNGDLLIGGFSILGLDDAAPTATGSTNNGSGTAWTTGNITAASGNCLVGGTFGDGIATTSTITSPASEAFDANNAGQAETITAGYKLSVSGTDVIAGTWASSLASLAVGASYAVTAGGGVTVKKLAAQGVG